jgi:hypothetical protein
MNIFTFTAILIAIPSLLLYSSNYRNKYIHIFVLILTILYCIMSIYFDIYQVVTPIVGRRIIIPAWSMTINCTYLILLSLQIWLKRITTYTIMSVYWALILIHNIIYSIFDIILYFITS